MKFDSRPNHPGGYTMKTVEFLNKIGIFLFGDAAGTFSKAEDDPDGQITDDGTPPKAPNCKENAEGQSA